MPNRPPYLVERSPGYIEYQLPISVKLVVDYSGKIPQAATIIAPPQTDQRQISGATRNRGSGE
jgi:hypothetical protein